MSKKSINQQSYSSYQHKEGIISENHNEKQETVEITKKSSPLAFKQSNKAESKISYFNYQENKNANSNSSK